MPTPVNFPEVVTATLGGPSNFSAAEDVLEFSATIRHVVIADWAALVLRAYISTDGGATWTLAANGPALKAEVGSPVYRVAAFTCDRVNNIIYAVYYSAATNQLSIVPFVATLAGGAFGAVVTSTLGYQAAVVSNSQIVSATVRAQYRTVDASVWIAFDNGRPNPAPPFQDVFVARYHVGVGVGAATKINTTNNNTYESVLGSMGLDANTGTIHLTFFDYKPNPPNNDHNLRHVSIDAAGAISVPDVVLNSATNTIASAGDSIAISAAGLIVLPVDPVYPTGDYQLAVGTAGVWTLTGPSFGVRSTNVGFLYPAFIAGAFYVFYTQFNPTETDFFYVTSADGLTWSAATKFGVYSATDPLDSNLLDFFPVVFAATIVGIVGIFPVSFPTGAAYWDIGGVTPVPPAVLGTKNPPQIVIFPFPRRNDCCEPKTVSCVDCINGKHMVTSKTTLTRGS